MDTLELARLLIACPSVTPDDAGTFSIIAPLLTGAGFEVEIFEFPTARNLWATRGTGPHFVINGHVDVVPPGPGWTHGPFEPTEADGLLIGRGACDMKSSVAAAVVAATRTAAPVAFLITSDEEGTSIDGTARTLRELLDRGTEISGALVIEPTCVERLGDTFKPGRRGSLIGTIDIRGIQGHAAYPERARNAAHVLAPALAELVAEVWDAGDEFFPPSTMQVFELTSGVGATNVIPGTARLGINFRHGPASPAETLAMRVESILCRHGAEFEARWVSNADPFLTPIGALARQLAAAVEGATGQTPLPSTGGGTSDARAFAAHGIEVVEFGPVPIRMHGADEAIRVADLEPLTDVYARMIEPKLA